MVWATPTITLSCALPFLPAALAVIMTGPPAATPVARPKDGSMVTIDVLPLIQLNATPLMTLPFASFAVAVNC